MLKMVDGTGIIGVDMICPLGVSAPQPPNYDRVELEGAGMLVLPNSLDAPLERLELGGKTEQAQTTGKNLFNIKTYRDMNGCEIINNNQLSFVQNLAKINYEIELDAGDYRISFNRKKYSSITIRNGETVLNTNGGEIDYGYTIKLSEPAVISIEFASGQNPNAEQRIIYNIQLEKSSTTTPYEPYTGGKPSPSPEYPQEIKSVGKWNDEKQKYEIEVVLSGKNLLDITACEDGKTLDANGNIVNNANALLSDFIPCFSKTSYCRVEGHFTAVSFYDVEKNKIGFINQYDPCFATPDKCRYFRFSLNKTKADYEKAVANVGTALMDYEPYKKPQTLTLTSDRPITKWDRLVEQGGEIGWLYSTGVYEDIKESDISANSINDQYGRYYVNAIKAYKNAECMCNIAEYSPAQKENKCGFWWSDTLCFFISSEYTGNNGTEDNSTAIKNFKDNVLSKGITVFYKLNTEEFVPLQQSEQNAIRALKTYYPTTVITADGGELDPDIKVTYRKEI